MNDDAAGPGALIRAVAAYGLPGSTLTLPSRRLSESEWRPFLRMAVSQRLTGLLAAAVGNDDLPVSRAQREEVDDEHVRSMVQCLLLERIMLEITTMLTGYDIDLRLLKGSAVAHLDYSDPALRPSGDVDLLLRGEQFHDAVARLEASGMRKLQLEPRPGFAARFGKGVTLAAPDGMEIDLHRTLAQGSYGLTIPLELLWQTPSTIVLAGQEVLALGPSDRFLHAAFHCALGSRQTKLLPVRDVAEMALFGSTDAHTIRQRATMWNAEAVLARAVRKTWQLLQIEDITALSRWAEVRRETEGERRRLAAYDRRGSPYTARALDALPYVDGVGAKIAFARSLALPRREFLEARGLDRRRWLAKGLRSARSSRTRTNAPRDDVGP
jgi:hypothetical protein